MAKVGLISGEELTVPETDAQTTLRRVTQSGSAFVELQIEGGTGWIRAAHVVYVRDDDRMPQVEETRGSLSAVDPSQAGFRP